MRVSSLLWDLFILKPKRKDRKLIISNKKWKSIFKNFNLNTFNDRMLMINKYSLKNLKILDFYTLVEIDSEKYKKIKEFD